VDEKQPASAFDLASLAYTDTAEIEVEHPVTGGPIGWTITVTGPSHPVAIALSDETARRVIQDRHRQTAAQINGRKWKPEEETPDGNREQNARYFARRILGWSKIDIQGEDYPFSQENAVKLLVDQRYQWLYRQIATFFAADEGFIKASAIH